MAILELGPGESREIKGDLNEIFSSTYGYFQGNFPAPDGKGPRGTGGIFDSFRISSAKGVEIKTLYVSKRDSGKVLLKFVYRKKGDNTDRILYAIENGGTYKRLGTSESACLAALAILELDPGGSREIGGDLHEIFSAKLGYLQGDFPAPNGRGIKGRGVISKKVITRFGEVYKIKTLHVSKRKNGKILLKITYQKKKNGGDSVIYMLGEGDTYISLGENEAACRVALIMDEMKPGEGPVKAEFDLDEIISKNNCRLQGSFPAPDGKGPGNNGNINEQIPIGIGPGREIISLYISRRKTGKILLKITYREDSKEKEAYLLESEGVYKRLGRDKAAGEIALAINELAAGEEPRAIEGDLKEVINEEKGLLLNSFPAPDGVD